MKSVGVFAVAVVAAAACGSKDGGGGGVLDDPAAPGAAIARCAVGAVAWSERGEAACRIDRDVPGLGCVRLLPERGQVGMYVWKGCAGGAVAATIARAKDGGATAVTLPAGLEAAAIAKLLVGDDAVVAEAAATGALAWVLDATHPQIGDDLDGIYRYAPHWETGVPQPPALAAAVLDAGIARADRTRAWSDLDVAGAQIVVMDAGAPLVERAACERWRVLSNGSAVAVQKPDRGRWSFIAIDGAMRKGDVPNCAGRFVEIARGRGGIASSLVVDAEAGVFADVETAQLDRMTVEDLGEIIGSPPVVAACPAGDGDLLAEGHAPCVAHGTGFTLVPRGGTQGLILERPGADPAVLAFHATLATLPTSDPAIAARLTAKPPARDPLLAWVMAGGKEGRFDDQGKVPTSWQPGSEIAIAPPYATIVPFDPIARGGDTPVIVRVAAPRPTMTATCGAFEVRASPAAGAIVDHAKSRWAWLYVDRDGTNAIDGVRCFGDIALFDHGGREKAWSVVADPRTGRWALLPAARVTALIGGGDLRPGAGAEDALREELAGEE